MEVMRLIYKYKYLHKGSACAKLGLSQAQACSTSKAKGTHLKASKHIHRNLREQNHANAVTSKITSNLMKNHHMFPHTHLSLRPSPLVCA